MFILQNKVTKEIVIVDKFNKIDVGVVSDKYQSYNWIILNV